jgi:hypothetical protein
MFEEMGVATGTDLGALLRTSREVGELLGVPVTSYATAGGTKAEVERTGSTLN